MELWNEKVLKLLGDEIGKFVNLKEGFHLKVDKRVVKMLVVIDSREGLQEEMEIKWGSW
jgi:hypothetical protein